MRRRFTAAQAAQKIETTGSDELRAFTAAQAAQKVVAAFLAKHYTFTAAQAAQKWEPSQGALVV